MRWNQSDRKVLTITAIIGVFLYAIYKGLQFLAGASMGASFGVGLGGMSGSQKVEESRKVETDAPAQIIYRIDKNRYLTLENYLSCDRGGQVYYNDSQRGIKTHLGWDNDFMISHIAGEIILRLIKALLLMGRIMVIWHSLAHLPDNIVVVEGQKQVALCFSSFQQIMGTHLYIKL